MSDNRKHKRVNHAELRKKRIVEEKFTETPVEERKQKYEHVRTKYHTNIKPYLPAIAAMCRNGATIEIISEKFQVAVSTLHEYKKKHPEFAECLKQNAEIADFTIEAALFEMAKTDKVAAFFWLKNRQSRRWRDRQHVFQQSTQVQKFEYDNLSDEELAKEEQVLDTVNVDDIDGFEFDGEGELH